MEKTARNKSIGNLNNVSPFTCEEATINNLTLGSNTNIVTSSTTLTTNKMIKGNGNKTVTTTSIDIDNSNNLTIPNGSQLNANKIQNITSGQNMILNAIGANILMQSGSSGNIFLSNNTYINDLYGTNVYVKGNPVLTHSQPDIKIEYFKAKFDNSGFVSSSPNITSGSWSPTGTLTVSIINNHFTTKPFAICQVFSGSNPGVGVFTSYYDYNNSTNSSLKFYGAQGGAGATNLDVFVILIGN